MHNPIESRLLLENEFNDRLKITQIITNNDEFNKFTREIYMSTSNHDSIDVLR